MHISSLLVNKSVHYGYLFSSRSEMPGARAMYSLQAPNLIGLKDNSSMVILQKDPSRVAYIITLFNSY